MTIACYFVIIFFIQEIFKECFMSIKIALLGFGI